MANPGAPYRWPVGSSEGQDYQDLSVDTRPRSEETSVLSLRLIATSDLHACLLPYDYCSNRPAAGRGLGEVARQIELARAEATNCLLFDNGDFLQGNPLADFVASVERRRRAHPVITAFNTLGYDAVTLGNHDFDYGLNFLTKTLGQARFPIVSANVTTKMGSSPELDQTLVPPFVLLHRQMRDAFGRAQLLRVGVIGFAPPRMEIWGQGQMDERVQSREILVSARAWLPKLKAAGADVIVALVHSGIGRIDAEDGMDDAATAIAAMPEIDAVVAGHSHQAFPGPGFDGLLGVDARRGCLAGKPAVMPGHSGSHFGIIDLRLQRERSDGQWRIVDRKVRLGARSAVRTPVAPVFQKAIAADHRATLAWSRRSLGTSPIPLTTYFATTAPSAAVGLIAAAIADHARQALAGSALGGVPVLASVTPFRVGGLGGSLNFTDIPAGSFRMRNLSDLYPFPNSLVTLAMTASDVALWLERSASIFNQITPGSRDAPLHDGRFPAFAFDCIPGLDYAINLSQPARFDINGKVINPGSCRIVGLALKGRLLAPDEPLLLVTTNHRASKIDLAAERGPRVVLADGVRIQAIIAEHIRAKEVIDATFRRNWHFLPTPGTTVRITTGTGARAHLADIAQMRPEFMHQDSDGFLHYRLHL